MKALGADVFAARYGCRYQRRMAVAEIMRLESRPVDSTTSLYWIVVDDEQGVR